MLIRRSFIFLCLITSACSRDNPIGAQEVLGARGSPPHPDGTCDPGLVVCAGLCQDHCDQRDAGTRPDATLPDAGTPDGAAADSGPRPDTGPTPDSGPRPDTGVPPTCPDPPGFDPNCTACRRDGECCSFSINCAAGSICNDPVEDLYNRTKPQMTCVRVLCTTDHDCAPDQTCSLEKLCRAPLCQTDSDCQAPGTICTGGQCRARPSPNLAASCAILTPHQTLVPGQTVALSAVAKNAAGAVLPGVQFAWASSNPSAVSVSGSQARGAGAQHGTAQITASVVGNPTVTCSGLSITNASAAPTTRYLVVEEDTGLPIRGAQVTATGTEGPYTGLTDDAGEWIPNPPHDTGSVTVVSAGFEIVTVFGDLTLGDHLIPLPRRKASTRAGGFRGSVDMSQTRRADIRIGFTGRPLPINPLDAARTAVLGESFQTTVNLPELGINNQPMNLPGGFAFALGSRRFTDDHLDTGGGVRCQGAAPGAQDLGCYVVSTLPGAAAAWTLSGQIRLSQTTAIAQRLFDTLSAAPGGLFPIDYLLLFSGFGRSMNHGMSAPFQVQEFPKVPLGPMVQADCSNLNQPNYDRLCRGDYARYSPIPLVADQGLGVLSVVAVPDLPRLPGGTACPGRNLLIASAELAGGGLVPLGFSAGSNAAPNCRIAGVRTPFGPLSQPLSDGSIPLAFAPLHSGLEGSRLVLLLLAVEDSPRERARSPIAAVMARRASVATHESLATLPYVPYPNASLMRTSARFSFDAAIQGATAVRIEIESPTARWLIYAPPDGSRIDLPSVPAARTVLTGMTRASITAFRIDDTYQSMLTLGSGSTLDRLNDHLVAFTVEECAAGAANGCALVP